MDTNQTSVFPMPQYDKLLERLSKLEHELHELKRTLPEIEAQARVTGYHEGQNDLKASICALIFSFFIIMITIFYMIKL